MNFTQNPNSVRAELFKPEGKWYETFELTLPDGQYEDWNMWKNYLAAFNAKGRTLNDGWMLVIFDPYNKHSHPMMIIGGQREG